ncbi:hypothetical protein P9112_004275 [Eukaryota sp. TZLM1-RC]
MHWSVGHFASKRTLLVLETYPQSWVVSFTDGNALYRAELNKTDSEQFNTYILYRTDVSAFEKLLQTSCDTRHEFVFDQGSAVATCHSGKQSLAITLHPVSHDTQGEISALFFKVLSNVKESSSLPEEHCDTELSVTPAIKSRTRSKINLPGIPQKRRRK